MKAHVALLQAEDDLCQSRGMEAAFAAGELRKLQIEWEEAFNAVE